MHDKHDLFTEAFVLQVTYIQSLKFQLLTDLEIFAFCFSSNVYLIILSHLRLQVGENISINTFISNFLGDVALNLNCMAK